MIVKRNTIKMLIGIVFVIVSVLSYILSLPTNFSILILLIGLIVIAAGLVQPTIGRKQR